MVLRIVHLGKYYHPHSGGIETHVRTLAQEQAARGNEVHVVCIAHDRSLAPEYWDGPVFVKRFAPRISLAKVDWVPEVGRYLDDLNCDILHMHVPNPAMTMAVLNMRRLAPMVVTYHSDVVGMPFRKWLFHPWDRRLLMRAEVIAATNPRMAESSERLLQHRERVRIIPLGVSLDRFVNPTAAVEQRAAEIQSETGQPIWLMCGRLVPYKGHSIALEALANVPGILMVIGDGPLRRKLQQQADELKLGDRVQFLGRVACDDEVAAYYRAATALWMTSIIPSEAFGLVQVEAMASGCPVINTNIPGSGVPWVSRHEETGLTVPVGDPRAFAHMANRLLAEPWLRERLSENARARALSEFNEHLMADRWQSLYEEVLSRRSSNHEVWTARPSIG